MTERHILCKAHEVRAILSGTQTQLRRAVKRTVEGSPFRSDWIELPGKIGIRTPPCSYGAPGDRLWVRETWRASELFDATKPSDWNKGSVPVRYEADDARSGGWAGHGYGGKRRPSIHMPRWASRITLEITGVRVERLQDISEADARAEGAAHHNSPAAMLTGYRQGYRLLWMSINGPGSWAANPWVWVLEFRRLGASA